MILKKIGVFSLARMLGGVYAGIGLIIGFFFSVASMIGGFAASLANTNSDEAAGALVGMLIGVGAIIFMPVIYGLLGFIGGALAAFVYNLVAGVFGGIEMTFVNKPSSPAAPTISANAP